MFYAYVIRSSFDGSYYKGHCENLDERLDQHNSGMTKSIKNKGSFEIVYYEIFETRPEAISREKYFKTGAGRRYLKSKILR
ncbi:MAG: GIY-YIG nuclease family protein [Bacteroidia bacterium]|nr:GIY-YIG nuclease family protein [Bacteroidia bacterium]